MLLCCSVVLFLPGRYIDSTSKINTWLLAVARVFFLSVLWWLFMLVVVLSLLSYHVGIRDIINRNVNVVRRHNKVVRRHNKTVLLFRQLITHHISSAVPTYHTFNTVSTAAAGNRTPAIIGIPAIGIPGYGTSTTRSSTYCDGTFFSTHIHQYINTYTSVLNKLHAKPCS